MNILLDGRVPCCREDLAALKGAAVWGNAFSEELSCVWERGAALYGKHCKADYRDNTVNNLPNIAYGLPAMRAVYWPLAVVVAVIHENSPLICDSGDGLLYWKQNFFNKHFRS